MYLEHFHIFVKPNPTKCHPLRAYTCQAFFYPILDFQTLFSLNSIYLTDAAGNDVLVVVNNYRETASQFPSLFANSSHKK